MAPNTPPRGRRIGEPNHLTPEEAGDARWRHHRNQVVDGLDTYSGLQCSICDRVFDVIDQFRGHVDRKGRPCPGGSADA